MIEVFKTSLPGVLKIKRKVSRDYRGVYAEIYRKEDYYVAGIKIDFDEKGEQDHSTSFKNVFRGLHGDDKTYKMVCCTSGKLWLYVVNYQKGTEWFGKWQMFPLSHSNGIQILIPPYYLNGHLVRSEMATFHYNQSACYSGAENQWSVRWNDPKFGLILPDDALIYNGDPILSPRDGGNPENYLSTKI